MSAFFSQALSLLTNPPGNLIYLLVLAFSVAGALQPSFHYWRSSQSPEARRAVLGLAILLGCLVLQFGLGGLALRGVLDAELVLPPMDRALTLVALAWIVWLWAFPSHSRAGDAAATLVSLLALGAAGLSTITRSGSTYGNYNQTIGDILWQAASAGLAMFGAALLLIRKKIGFVSGTSMLVLAFLGHAAHVLFGEAGDYSGAVRLAYIAAYPILLSLPQKFVAPIQDSAREWVSGGAAQPEPRRYGAEMKALDALLALASDDDVASLEQRSVRAAAHVMLADLCFLARFQDGGQASLSTGYDLIQDKYLQDIPFDAATLPRITNAIQRGHPLRLLADSTSPDISGLSALLGLQNVGGALCAPVHAKDGQSRFGMLLLAPYSNRAWNGEDQNVLVDLAGGVGPILVRAQARSTGQSAWSTQEELTEAAGQIAMLEQRNVELSKELEAITLQQEPGPAHEEELEALRSSNNQLQRDVERLLSELKAARSAPPEPDSELERQLKAALRDAASLQNELAESNHRILDLERGAAGDRRKKEQAEVIASISQELRQPMSSVIGYTDLLLGESVGILGALQRKFVERIKASTERIGSLVEDMIQLNTMEVGLTDLKPEAMDLNLIIDNALAYTSSQVREKKISIHLDLPKDAAAVSADREALQQILIHLLQNAGSATPMEGTISIKVQTTKDEGQDFVMIQVTDSGGGIPEEDLPRVFTRLFRADNVLIQGVGDTGVGLSIAKTLTEAQHGRIWVESHPGSGATFNVLLPAVGSRVDYRPSAESS
jgi:signal transduction histidine kinase